MLPPGDWIRYAVARWELVRRDRAVDCSRMRTVVFSGGMDQEQVLKDILETVVFLKDHSVSKEDAGAFATKDDLERFATKDDLAQMKGEIMTHLDALVVLHKKLDEERLASQANFDRLAGQVRRLAEHVHFHLEGV